MDQKYLPIGSVCTLKGKNKKVMITGYYSVEFKGNLTIKDYCGCVYPEGMLLPESICNFNHTDIESIDFIGFKNNDQIIFQNLLNRLTGNENSKEDAAKFHKDNDMFLTSNSSYSKLLFDENGVVMIADPIKKEPIGEKTLPSIGFDKNGVVTSVNNDIEVVNPFHKEYNDVPAEPKENSNSIFKNIEFDENGTVVSDETNTGENKNSMLNDIKFDENGVVISANNEQIESQNSDDKYKFDANGILISDGENTAVDDAVENIPPIGPGLPNYQDLTNKELENNAIDITTNIPLKEEPLSNVEFDENGMVISANGNKFQQTENKPNFKFDENGTVIGVE